MRILVLSCLIVVSFGVNASVTLRSAVKSAVEEAGLTHEKLMEISHLISRRSFKAHGGTPLAVISDNAADLVRHLQAELSLAQSLVRLANSQ